tara:strand:- start:3802 stop:5109 length:1308 start_codon:yes stop_codon:yes gene_type:complete
MSVTIADSPNSLTVKGQQLVYVCSSTNSAQTNFKYIVVVKNEGGTQIAKFYMPKNADSKLIFNLRDVVREEIAADIVDSQEGDKIIHEMPYSPSKFMTVADKGCKKYTVEFGEVYGDPLAEQAATATDTIYLFDGWLQIRDGYQNVLSQYMPTVSSVRGFLTDRPNSYSYVAATTGVVIKASESDSGGTLAFLNDDTGLIASLATQLEYSIYNASGLIVTEAITYSSTYGGELGSSTTAEDKLLYFAAYPSNVNNVNHGISAGNRPVANTDWTYYTWRLKGGGSFRSLPFIFENSAAPCKHKATTIAWVNSLGAWDYMRFDGRTANRISARSKDYMQSIGSYGGSTYSYDSFDRQQTPYHVEAKQMYTLKSTPLTVSESELLRSLLKSKNAMLSFNDSKWLPVVIKTGSLQYETETISKALVASINVEIAQREEC